MKKEKTAKSKNKTDQYSVTEVGALVGSFHNEIKAIAEGQVATERRLGNVETELHGVNRRLDMVELGLDVVNGKVTRMEDGLLKLSKDLKETGQELKAEIAETRTELKANIHELSDRIAVVESKR